MRSTLAAVASLLLVLAACAPPPVQPPAEAPDTSEADAAAIRAHVSAFLDAWNSGDQEGLAPMIASGAVMMQPDGPTLEGRDPILDAIVQNYDATVLEQTAVVEEVVSLGDHAYGRGTWTLTPRPDAGDDVEGAGGKWSVLYARSPEGEWQISRWMWNQPAG